MPRRAAAVAANQILSSSSLTEKFSLPSKKKLRSVREDGVKTEIATISSKPSPTMDIVDENSTVKDEGSSKSSRGRNRTGRKRPIKIKEDDSKCGDERNSDNWSPPNWECVLDNIRSMRKTTEAPVDTMGCDQCKDETESPKVCFCFSNVIESKISSRIEFYVFIRLVWGKSAISGTLFEVYFCS